MAQTTLRIRGNFQSFITHVRNAIINGSASASLEDEINYRMGDVQIALLVSLSVMVTGQGDDLAVSAVASGGSEAVLFKINTFGEEAFLEKFNQAVVQFRSIDK